MTHKDYDLIIDTIKQDIKQIEKYIEQLETGNIYWDTATVETIIEELEIKVRYLYALIEPL